MTPLAFLATVCTALRGLLPLVVVLALLSSGCTPRGLIIDPEMKHYEGPELPESEIAVVETRHLHGGVLGLYGLLPFPLYRHRTFVYQIDGKGGLATQIHILPGQHSATAYYQRYPDVTLCGLTGCLANFQTHGLSIDFTVEAGHEYRIPAEHKDERYWIWVEDITSGKVVAGEKPPDD